MLIGSALISLILGVLLGGIGVFVKRFFRYHLEPEQVEIIQLHLKE